MKKIEEFGLDDQIGLSYSKRSLDLLNMSKDQLIELGLTELQAMNIGKGKCGYMTIQKISNNPGYLISGEIEQGWCGCFAKGFACVLYLGSQWYHTSNINNIDWDKKEFTTLNSTYKFTLDEYDVNELLNYLNNGN